MPDGETGEPRGWMVRHLESLRTHPDLELTADGTWRSYADRPRFRVKRGHRLRWIDLGHFDAFSESWKAYEDMVAGSGRRFQVGIPSPSSLAVLAFGSLNAVPHLAPFRNATIREIGAIWGRGRATTLFQVGMPIELVALSRVPPPARPALARGFARDVLRLVEAAPSGSSFGLHLCLGDLNNRVLTNPADAAPFVALANAVMAEWPTGRTLDYVHAPLAHGRHPPTMDPDYYAPLERLWIPGHVRFIAGIVHEATTIKKLVLVRDQIEHHLNRHVDVAASCGLGRRTREAARLNLEIARAVALAD